MSTSWWNHCRASRGKCIALRLQILELTLIERALTSCLGGRRQLDLTSASNGVFKEALVSRPLLLRRHSLPDISGNAERLTPYLFSLLNIFRKVTKDNSFARLRKVAGFACIACLIGLACLGICRDLVTSNICNCRRVSLLRTSACHNIYTWNLSRSATRNICAASDDYRRNR